jgi:hypothetical protein
MEDGCVFGQDCPIFDDRLARLPGMAHMFRARYCDGSPDRCVRHLLALEIGASLVPDDLMPNDMETAVQLGLRPN